MNRFRIGLAAVAGIAGLTLAGLAVALLAGASIPVEMNPSTAVLTASGLLILWSILARGNKRTAWGITLAAAVLLVLLSLDYWNRTGGDNPAATLAARWLRRDILAVTGMGLLVASRLVSLSATLNTRRYLAGATVLTVAAIGIAGALVPGDLNAADLSYAEGRDALMDMLHPGAGDYIEDIDDYVDDLLDDETLDPEDREAEIRALNERIRAMEAELALFEATRERNSAQEAEIAALRKQVEDALKRAAEAESRPDGRGGIIVTLDGEEVSRVRGFAAAVKPEAPIVRDFAVALASKTPGSYYRDDGDPWAAGTAGVSQIIAIHGYISSEWKYVNDPSDTWEDYYSPAHRTIAAGLAGDCDDFAVLVSSAIEAVGGKTRIMGGSCSGGHHAWPEVYIGNRAAFNNAMSVISKACPGRKIQYMTDGAGGHWLCLDWQLGEYSCGADPHILYQRIGGNS